MPISEIQSRWTAAVFAKKVKGLPTCDQMKADVEKVRRDMAKRYVSSQRHTIQVDAGKAL